MRQCKLLPRRVREQDKKHKPEVKVSVEERLEAVSGPKNGVELIDSMEINELAPGPIVVAWLSACSC